MPGVHDAWDKLVKKQETPPVDPGWSAWETLAILGFSLLLTGLPYLLGPTARGLGAALVAYVLQVSCFFLLPLFLVTVVRGREVAALGFAPTPLGPCLRKGLAAGLVLYGLNIAVCLAQALIFPQALQEQQSIIDLFGQATGPELAFLILLVLFFAPISEELLFRAYFFPALQYRFGRRAGYLICAAVFAATHMNLWSLLPVFLGGLGFCWVYDKYRNIWYNVAAHMAWNGVALVLYFISAVNAG